jgi:LL-diaminopimelate aminotransferase
MKPSILMHQLESGIFSELAKEKAALITSGIDVIDLGVGTPNIPPAPHIRQTLSLAAQSEESYIYAIDDLPELKEAAAAWYARRYGVVLDAGEEVCAVLGTQEGLAHCCLPVVDPGDTVILPDPCYPAFFAGAALAHAQVFRAPQRSENGFIIDFQDIPEDIALKAKLMIVSYPNNPTTAVAPDSFYRDLIAFAQRYDIFVIHDNAYSELAFDGLRVGSFLGFPGAKDVGAEFNSLSKTYGYAGARLGFCLGNRDYIAALRQLKSNTDYGVFLPIQKAGIAAMETAPEVIAATAKAYEQRRDALIDSFGNAGWQIDKPKATMFVWAKLPAACGQDDVAFSAALRQRAGVIVTPGSAFGPGGRGFVRMALVQSEERIREASERIRGVLESGI